MKPEIIFDKHDGKLVRLEDYKELEEENKEIRNRIIKKLEVIIKLKKELSDLKELILKTINIFKIALELKEVKK